MTAGTGPRRLEHVREGCAAFAKPHRLNAGSEVIWARLQRYAKRVFEQRTAPVRERLTEPAIAAAWGAGRAMSEDDAVSFALATAAELAPR